MEYRVSTLSGEIWTEEEYRDSFGGIQNEESFQRAWGNMLSISINEVTNEVRNKYRFIYKPDTLPKFDIFDISDVLIKDPTRLLKIVPKNPRQ